MNLKGLFQEGQEIRAGSFMLRPVREEDAEGLLAMYGDERIYRYRPGLPRTTLPLVEKVIRRLRQGMEAGEGAAFVILEEKGRGAAAGLVEVFHIDARVEQVEIGYTVMPDRQGRGIATAAVGGVTDYLIWEIGFNRVRAAVHVDNEASRRVLLKNGFTLEGRERQGEFWQGMGFVDLCRFAKLRMDYG